MIRDIYELVEVLSEDDYNYACAILGTKENEPRIWMPDLTIAPDGTPYLYRWHVLPYKRIPTAGLYFHIQVASDPERPLHDHPWENTTQMISGSYIEMIQSLPPYGAVERFVRVPGDQINRAATEAHRLILPDGIPYTMTLFLTGPKTRNWGYWFGPEWHHNERHVQDRGDGTSGFVME